MSQINRIGIFDTNSNVIFQRLELPFIGVLSNLSVYERIYDFLKLRPSFRFGIVSMLASLSIPIVAVLSWFFIIFIPVFVVFSSILALIFLIAVRFSALLSGVHYFALVFHPVKNRNGSKIVLKQR